MQEAKRIEQQIVQAKSQAELERQKALADQNRQKVEADTEQIRQTVTAEQDKVEQVIAARTRLEVSQVELDAASKDAQALLTLAEAERKVVAAANQARADLLKTQVSVYKNDSDYVRSKLYEKVGPNIESVITSDSGGTILGLPLGSEPPAAKPKQRTAAGGE